MSRQHADSDPEFGSDSFLDIIANIVGILIILIVIAGVKVARQSASDAARAQSRQVAQDSDSAAARRENTRLLERDERQLFEVERRLSETLVEFGELEAAYDRGVAEESELTHAQRRVDATLATHQRDEADSRQLLAGIGSETDTILRQTTELRKSLASANEDQRAAAAILKHVFERQESANAELQQTSQLTAELQEMLTSQEAAAPEQQHVQHRLSPVATTGTQELHFRLSEGRIAWIPLDALLKRLKSQVRNRVDLIRRFGRYEGTCGPVGGFLMKYQVERQAPTPLDALNGVQNGVRIEVSRWTVVPANASAPELVSAALQPGSRFRQTVEAADPDATITIWLYAEDFPLFRDLREFAHQLDLRVAARPLPDGTPISGSPGGSRSNAQ